jgi:hypothetical protein
MSLLLHVIITVAFGMHLSAAGGLAATRDDAPHQALAAFAARVQAYQALHEAHASRLPAVPRSSDPGEIRRAIDALGDAIRAARFQARLGDVFTPDVAVLFRRAIRESCDGDLASLLETTADDIDPMPTPMINGRWPGEGVPFMPPNLLARLPELPGGLQYRFAGRDLVLWDSRADLIVDIIRDAIPPLTLP